MMAVDNGLISSSTSNSSSTSHSSCSNEECPLCLEILDIDDKSFFPCTCGYQICRFCWHRIRSEISEESKGCCPACRKAYGENPANFKALSVEDVQQKLKQQKRQQNQLKKQKTVDSRKHLADLRVVQKNLVFVVGITPRIADPELLKKNEYFGKFGKIHKIVVNNVTSNSPGVQYGAYITYIKSDDALRAIQSVNNIPFDGKTIKASLGTTKYCSHFMRNQSCPKPECMYLHHHGDLEASFTKEDMQIGKHQEYEKKLIEEFNKNKIVVKRVELPKEEEVVEKQETVLMSGLKLEEEDCLDFDPFYETQKAFEKIIQDEVSNYGNTSSVGYGSIPPGFVGCPWQPINPEPENWMNLDPAIIFSSPTSNREEQEQQRHLLGNSLINDVFANQQFIQNRPQQNYVNYVQPKTSPPPGFQQQQQQFQNNNFFYQNQFPF